MSKPYYNIGGTTQGEFGIRVGQDGVGELRLIHDGVDAAIRNDTGTLYLQGGANIGLSIADDGTVDLVGPLMASSNEGISGQVLASQGPGLPAVWRTSSGGSIEMGYNFNNTTASTNPGSQKLGYNDTTFTGTTVIRFNITAFTNFDASTILSLLQDGNRIYMQQRNDASKAAVFQVTGVGTNMTGWWTVPVVHVNSLGTPFPNNADLNVVFILSTSSTPTYANPTATIGLTAVNGSLFSGMRSDAAPALSQSIAPTWSATHTFSLTPVVPNDSWTYAKIQNVSATSRVLGRITSGAGDIEELTGANLTTIIGGSALTKTDDTNVTLTLGGTPTTALLVAASLTLGWTGLLSVARGGSGIGTLTGYLKGNGTSAFSAVATIPYGDLSGTPTVPVGANPTGTVGLTAVNGSAVTFLRSDGAPALSQAIAPTWSATHIFSKVGSASTTSPIVINSNTPLLYIKDADGASNRKNVRLYMDSGAFTIDFQNDAEAVTSTGFSITYNNAVTALSFGNATDNPTYTFLGTGAGAVSGTWTFNLTPVVPNDSWTYAKIQNVSATSRVLGRITSGAGDIEELTGANLATIIGTSLGANPSASVGLTAVNGSAATYMRSDGAPALSVGIVPTWTGIHTFSARPVFNDGITVNDAARQVASLVDTAHSYGNTTDNPTYTYLGSGLMAVHGQLSVGDGGSTGDKIRIRNSTAVGVGTNYHHYINFASATQLHLYAWDGASTNIGALRISHVQVFHADGTAANPVISFNTDQNNGLYFIGADNWAASAGGAKVMEWLIASSGGAKVADTAGTMYTVGYREIPQNSKSAAYTLVSEDSGKHIFHPSADTTARIWTIPSNASVPYPIGTAVTFINQNAGGVITIAITTDTMRLSPGGTTGSRTLAANGIATAVKVTSTEWIISGTGLT